MWYELQIENAHRDQVDELSETLEETGALSITLTDKNDDPILEPELGTTPLWPDVVIHVLYNEKSEALLTKQCLGAQYTHLSYSIKQVLDEDWERVWMNDFKPQLFGKKLWICPSWCEPPEPEGVNLILDPGLAFGTGTHPTTSLCLSWLDEADLTNKTIIDYGCGSGILALAAIKLGAKKAYGVDIDEQALQATRNNALSNHITAAQLNVGMPQSLNTPVDIVIANILLAPLLNLGSRFSQLLNNKGTLVVSGLLADQASALIEAYQAEFSHKLTTNLTGWSLLAFTSR